MATRRGIAGIAGVSTATVTNVLNNRKFVSKPVRDKVLGAARQVGYQVVPPRAKNPSLFNDIVFVTEEALNPQQGAI